MCPTTEAANAVTVRPNAPAVMDVTIDTTKAVCEVVCVLQDIRRELLGIENTEILNPVRDEPPCMIERMMFNADMATRATNLAHEILNAIIGK